MDRIAVSSSNIRAIGYDEKTASLEVEFKGGGLYKYSGVSAGVYQGFMASPSKGRYFDSRIRDKYPTVKLR